MAKYTQFLQTGVRMNFNMDVTRRKFMQVLGLTAASTPLIIKASSLDLPGIEKVKKSVFTGVELVPVKDMDYFETKDESIISYIIKSYVQTYDWVNREDRTIDTNAYGPVYYDLTMELYLMPNSRMVNIELNDIVHLKINHMTDDVTQARWDVSKKMMLVSKDISARVQEFGICELEFKEVK